MSAGASPQTPLGELTAPPDPLAGLRGPTSKGRGRERDGRGKGRERGGEGEREWRGGGREGEGKGGEGAERGASTTTPHRASTKVNPALSTVGQTAEPIGSNLAHSFTVTQGVF